MAIIGVTSLLPRKTTILPEGGRDFLHRRMMELVGVAVAHVGFRTGNPAAAADAG